MSFRFQCYIVHIVNRLKNFKINEIENEIFFQNHHTLHTRRISTHSTNLKGRNNDEQNETPDQNLIKTICFCYIGNDVIDSKSMSV